MQITKIVVTGGPSAGKTTGMSWIQNAFARLGYTVLFVPETATELITGGVAPWTCGTNLEYQRCQMRLQLEKERLFEQAARTMKADKILIVCDRGALDNKAYMNDEEFAAVLAETGKTEEELRGSYAAVFHMVTAAKGAEKFYTRANNRARYEDVDAAVALDERLLAAWAGHPHLHVIDNSENFEAKLKRLIAEIRRFLGEPEPMTIKRRFLIEYPDIAWLESQPGCRKQEIEQTYLAAGPGDELRVRKRRENGVNVYFKTLKRRVEGLRRIEIEERLSRKEYLELLREADPRRRPIKKTRYCLTWEDKAFEIDLYPFWQDKAIVEQELSEDSAALRFPEQLKVLHEITDDPAYAVSALAVKKEDCAPRDAADA